MVSIQLLAEGLAPNVNVASHPLDVSVLPEWGIPHTNPLISKVPSSQLSLQSHRDRPWQPTLSLRKISYQMCSGSEVSCDMWSANWAMNSSLHSRIYIILTCVFPYYFTLCLIYINTTLSYFMYLGIRLKIFWNKMSKHTYAKLSEQRETKKFEGLRIRENLKPRFFHPEDNMICKALEGKEISFLWKGML